MKVGVPGWLTHLLAASFGVALWYASHSPSPPAARLASLPTAHRSAASPAEAEVIRRLEESREEDRRNEQQSTEVVDAAPHPDTRTRSQLLLDMRKEGMAETRAELEALLKRSKDFEKVVDLRVPLTESLLGEVDFDKAVAVFMEWHRRDPIAAFDELAARTMWATVVLSTDAMMMFLKPEELLAQMDSRNRSSDFRERIVGELADYLVETDDLQSLSSYFAKLDPVWSDALISGFVSEEWIPRDGVAALSFVSNRMEESCRKALISKLAEVSPSDSSREWSGGIAAPLFKEILGEEMLATLRQKSENNAKLPLGGCCGGGGDDERLPDRETVAKAMLEKTPEAFDWAVGRMLLHDKDYPELFASGRISGDEALHAMMAAIPGSKNHENEVRRAIYRKFALWNPKAAVGWAAGHLTNEDLQSVSKDFQEYGDEPRALHLLGLMEALPSKFSDGKLRGGMALALYNALEDWRIMAPEAAEAAMTRSPETIALVERLKVKPENVSDSSVLPQVPWSEEDGNANTTPEGP